MTKTGNRSWGIFFSFVLIVLMMNACAKSGTATVTNETISDSTEIIGGEKVTAKNPIFGKVLYLAYDTQIQQNGERVTWKGRCTASALSTRVVLTAAHCVAGKDLRGVYITFGQKPESDPLIISQWYAAQKILVHPGYIGSPQKIANDLALILLDRDLPAARVMKLASAQQVRLPMNFISVGYGITTASSDSQVKDQSYDGLRMIVKRLEALTLAENSFALDQRDHKGFCSGDSGGPGVIQDPNTKEFFILGVVSNNSMLSTEDQQLDPQGIYSLCIGRGNYMNTLNPALRSWIETSMRDLLR